MAEPPKSSIRDKFGVDYLITGKGSSSFGVTPDSTADTQVERALAAFGNRVLKMIEDAPQKSLRLHHVVDVTGLNMETLLAMTDRMVRSDLVEVVAPDKYGNHLVRITMTGEELLRQFS
jgi:hypothetical protein